MAEYIAAERWRIRGRWLTANAAGAVFPRGATGSLRGAGFGKKHPAPLAGGRKIRAMPLKKSNKTCTKVNLAWVPGTHDYGRGAGARGGRIVSGRRVYVFPAVVLWPYQRQLLTICSGDAKRGAFESELAKGEENREAQRTSARIRVVGFVKTGQPISQNRPI